MTESRLTRGQTVSSALTVVLAAIAAGVGLFVPHFYRDPALVLPQVYGQDLLTLAVAVPALALSLVLARRGSLRAHVVWLGVTAYLLYTYASYAFMTVFNELYLVYVALLWLTLYAFVDGLARFDAAEFRAAVADVRVWPFVAFEVLLAVLVGALWLAEIVPATLAGTTPQSAVDAGLPVNVIHSLDLGVILPAYLLTAVLLWQRRDWGYVFTAILLAKGVTLGLAILSMVLLMTLAEQAVPLPQIVVFGTITVAATGLLVSILLAVGPERRRRTAATPAPGADD